MSIIRGRENFITPENVDTYKINEMLQVCMEELYDHDEDDDKTTFVIASKEDEHTVTSDGYFNKIITFYKNEHNTEDTAFAQISFEREDFRKYYTELVDVEILHNSIKKFVNLAENGYMELYQTHDEPVHYFSNITFRREININDGVKSLVSMIKSFENELYLMIFELAAKNQFDAMVEYKEKLKNEINNK